MLVEEDEVEVPVAEDDRQGVLARATTRHVVAGFRQLVTDEEGDFGVVFDEEQFQGVFHHPRSPDYRAAGSRRLTEGGS